MADDAAVRCYGHVFDPAHRKGPHITSEDGWSAHTWRGLVGSGLVGCQFCHKSLATGDRYVCVDGGAMHAACVADLDAALLPKEADRG